MPTKKPGAGRPHKPRATKAPAGPITVATDLPLDRHVLEHQLTAVTRLLQGHEFTSVDEINAFLQETLGDSGMLPPPVASTPLERAQDMVYEAFQATGKRRLDLAREALAVSPDCADAYVVLAEAARTMPEARRLYEQGVAAAERAIGPQEFMHAAGHFWGVIETRPYMRARLGLAEVLWAQGEREQAIAHARDLLHLNPGDNQGIRYYLANWLLEIGDDAALGQLLAQYPDEWSAQWAYAGVLLALRRDGPGPAAERALRHALEVNPHVPVYLLEAKPPPKQLPGYYGMGDENEALVYLGQAALAWRATSGAREWIARALIHLAMTAPDPDVSEPPPQSRTKVGKPGGAKNQPRTSRRS